jgi:hypothetical protein
MAVFREQDVEALRAEPMSREEADSAYRRLRAIVVLSDLWFIALGIVCAVLDFPGWQFLLGAAVASTVLLLPLTLFVFRREYEVRVRAGEEALGKLSQPSSAPPR